MQENVNIPDSTITTNLSFRQLVLMNMQQLTNFPYIEKDFDALTDYELLSLVVKYLNDVITNQNEQNASITRMYESFLALQTYVNNTKDTLENAFNELDDYVRNYFANLDVQEEINNKLDDMADSGQLTDIIAQYLGLAGMIAFDNVASMKLAENLVNGSKCQTFGYYSVNDGGNAFYKIRTKTVSDVIDEASLIALYDETLVAELINDEVNANMYGAYGDGIHDDTQAIQKYFSSRKFGDIIRFVNGCKYYITSPTYIPEECSIDFNWATFVIDSEIDDFAIYYGYRTDGTRVGDNRLRTYANNFYCITNDEAFHQNCNFIKVGREATISHFDSRYIDCVIKWDEDYIDFSVVKYGYISSREDSTNYAIQIEQQGDLCEISHIQQGRFLGTRGQDHLIYIGRNHYNVLVKDIIGCIDCYSPVTMENIMLSYDGVINQYGENIELNHIRGSLNLMSNNRINIYGREASSAPNYIPTITLNDIIFSYSSRENALETGVGYPIYIDNFDTLKINNVFNACFRVVGNNALAKAFTYIKFNSDFSDMEQYINKFIIYYNGKSFAKNNYKLPFSYSKPNQESCSYTGVSTTAAALFFGETGTYYYTIQKIYDEDLGVCTSQSSEFNASATNGSNSILFKKSGSSNNVVGRYIVRRGTETGVYTHYCILATPTTVFVDNGLSLNGLPWIEGTKTISPVVTNTLEVQYFGEHKKIISPGNNTSFTNSLTNGDVFIKNSSSNYGVYCYLNDAWRTITLS